MKNIKESGITLIALVVTIIILLILAGVTIGVATNNSGLFEKAKLATDEYNNKAQLEEIELSKITKQIDYEINSSTRESSFKRTRLWTNNPTASDVNTGTVTGEIALSDSIENYDAIRIVIQKYDTNGPFGTESLTVFNNEYYSDTYYGTTQYHGFTIRNGEYFYFGFDNTKPTKLCIGYLVGDVKLVSVEGINF